jgi:hypothetical protein
MGYFVKFIKISFKIFCNIRNHKTCYSFRFLICSTSYLLKCSFLFLSLSTTYDIKTNLRALETYHEQTQERLDLAKECDEEDP